MGYAPASGPRHWSSSFPSLDPRVRQRERGKMGLKRRKRNKTMDKAWGAQIRGVDSVCAVGFSSFSFVHLLGEGERHFLKLTRDGQKSSRRHDTLSSAAARYCRVRHLHPAASTKMPICCAGLAVSEGVRCPPTRTQTRTHTQTSTQWRNLAPPCNACHKPDRIVGRAIHVGGQTPSKGPAGEGWTSQCGWV